MPEHSLILREHKDNICINVKRKCLSLFSLRHLKYANLYALILLDGAKCNEVSIQIEVKAPSSMFVNHAVTFQV
jgi:hypothetical protein